MQAALQHLPPLISDCSDSESDLANVPQKFAALEERVANHIKFFWAAVACGFAWLAILSTLIYQMNGTVNHIDKTQTSTNEDLTKRVVAAELITLKSTFDTAQQTHEIFPEPQLADYKQTLQKSPSSSPGYWTTVASLINYQSFVDQALGEAPDPSKVSQPCGMVGPKAHNNTFIGLPTSDCLVELDTENFENVTFRNSVIHYKGGPVSLISVRFVNCRFVLDIPRTPVLAPTSPQTRFLLTLLNSPDQTNVQISTTS
jgi:hypothetical protein